MVLNYGAQPWKFPPRDGFSSFVSAPEKQVVENRKRGDVEERKIVKNAPQAIIIEVQLISNNLIASCLLEFVSLKELNNPQPSELVAISTEVISLGLL